MLLIAILYVIATYGLGYITSVTVFFQTISRLNIFFTSIVRRMHGNVFKKLKFFHFVRKIELSLA